MLRSFKRVILIVLGFVLVSLLIWFGWPFLGITIESVPNEDVVRLILIGLVIAAWLVTRLLKVLRANRASDRLMAAVVRQPAGTDQPSADAVRLRERFEEAVASLKQKRRSGHSLYDLPWYIIIGAPGSGKTTALVNSGLHFPIEQRSGKGALRGVGGTRNCDWWFTDEAVFLDTAGRYTTQDSDASADSAGWAEFLALLKKYRQRRPVNGVILAISAHDLMVQGHGGREEHVAAARRRLDELNQKLGIQLPVYLLVTKCDLVAGFSEYFDDLPQEARAQVWGVTFPYDRKRNSEVAQAFPVEFDALLTRLNERLFARVEEERDVRRRARVFGFPQQLAALRESLVEFVGEVFASTRFDRFILLRGVYFTSGTQEGNPIDRLLGAIGRQFAVAPDAMVSSGGRGKAYFIERLLKEVLIPESGLAGINRRLELKKGALQLGAYVGMLVVTVLGVIVMYFSYSASRRYIDNVAASIEMLSGTPPASPDAPRAAIAARLDAVLALADDAGVTYTPWYRRWGLYQGASVGDAARTAYFRELNNTLVPRVRKGLEARINPTMEPEDLYEYLKGYLMLGEEYSRYLDAEPLAALSWDDEGSGDALTRHFARILDDKTKLRPVALDADLVKQARSTIHNAKIQELVYRNVARHYDSDGQGLRLDLEAGLGVAQVLRFKSGRRLSDPVSRLYTKPVFRELTNQDVLKGDALKDVVDKYTSERWVWGDANRREASSYDAVRAAVIDIYENRYIETWETILNDIKPVSMPDMTSLKASLAVLAGPKSPVRGFLVLVAEHTLLVEPPKAPAPGLGRIDELKKKYLPGALKSAPLVPGKKVTDHFDYIHRAVAGPVGNAPVDAPLGILKKLGEQLATSGTGVGETQPSPETQRATRELAKSLEASAEGLPPFTSEVANDVARAAVAVVGRGVGSSFMELYRNQVVSACEELIRGRYPFAPSSPRDVQLGDFGLVFGYNGVFDRFFKEELQKYVDGLGPTLRWREHSPVTSAGMLAQFQRASRIRETFFQPNSQEVGLQFSVQATGVGTNFFLLELDGQRLEYQFVRDAQTFKWPGPNPGQAIVTWSPVSGSERPRLPDSPYTGAWAMFRLIDAGSLRPEASSSDRYILTLQKGAYTAQVRIEARSSRNPFARRSDLQGFSCGS